MQKWSLFQEKGTWVIRRVEEVGGKKKNKRLPISKYRSIREDEPALREFVARLNAPIRVRQAVDIRHAFITPTLLDSYKDFLIAQIPTRQNAICEYGYLMKYILGYFVNEMGIENPLEWHKIHKEQWANYLLGLDLAPNTLRHIVMAVNRFAGWLNGKRPNETPIPAFSPLSAARFRKLTEDRRQREESGSRRHVTPADWKKIQKKLPTELLAPATLSYYFGLRRNETLGLRPEDVRKAVLFVRRQVMDVSREAHALKGRAERKIPYWFMSPKDAYELIAALPSCHPHTVSDKWEELMREMGMDYLFHELRHSFITQALAKHPPREVQLAAGHKHISTTMGYAHDHREQDEEQWTPAA